MEPTRTAFGTWSGGRFMHFGETLGEDRFCGLVHTAWAAGIRTFVTSDVYGNGKADELLGAALADYDRGEYSLVGMVGHDFYEGQRQGSRGYPRFTDPELRGEDGYAKFLRTAASRSLERCRSDRFDLLMLHNPDQAGYTSEAVWQGFAELKAEGMCKQVGIAPGPANGFVLDVIHAVEKFEDLIDWAMLILNPLEPWPASLALPICEQRGVKVMTRVADYGGLFHGDVSSPDHVFKPGDHRAYRPEGWVGRGLEKIAGMREIADAHGLSLIQFAALWNLSQPAVASVVPTFIQEADPSARPIEDQIRDFAALPEQCLRDEEIRRVREIGDNVGCMTLKGASNRHETSERPDEWPMREDLRELAGRHGLGDNW